MDCSKYGHGSKQKYSLGLEQNSHRQSKWSSFFLLTDKKLDFCKIPCITCNEKREFRPANHESWFHSCFRNAINPITKYPFQLSLITLRTFHSPQVLRQTYLYLSCGYKSSLLILFKIVFLDILVILSQPISPACLTMSCPRAFPT